MPIPGSRFDSDLQVRPDDIDMNQHVHGSRYMDYVLAARFDQMGRCYGMPMDEFTGRGYAWFVRTAHIEYKRPLGLGEFFTVRTWVELILKDTVTIRFEITKKLTGKMCAEGHFACTMVKAATGRGELIPDWVVEKYSV